MIFAHYIGLELSVCVCALLNLFVATLFLHVMCPTVVYAAKCCLPPPNLWT